MKLGHQSSSPRSLVLRKPFSSSERTYSSLQAPSERPFSHKTDQIVASLTSRMSPQPGDSPALETRSYNPSGRASPRQPGHFTSRLNRDPEDKIDLLKGLLREKTMKIDDLTLENELLRNKAEVADKERDAMLQDYQKLKARTNALAGQLNECRAKLIEYKDITLFSPSPELLQKAQRYSDFIDLKMHDFPAFQRLFHDRAGGTEAFSELLKAQDHFNALLVCLQVIADLMVMQTEESSGREASVQDISDLPISPIEATSRVQSFVTRVEDEYEKMVDESRRLRRKIDHQSVRIASLSQQMALRLGTKADNSHTSTLPNDYEIPHRGHRSKPIYFPD